MSAGLILEFEERFLSAVLDSVIDAVIVIDARGEILLVNPAATDIFGASAEALIGRNVNRLMPSPHRERHDEYIACYLQSGQSGVIGRRRELEALRSDGRIFPMELAVTEMEAEGRRLFVGLIRDLSEQKRVQASLDEERQRAEELRLELLEREKLATLGGLVAGVAHEVGTPLGTALLACSDARKRVGDLLTEGNEHADPSVHLKRISKGLELAESNLSRAAGMMQSFKEIAVDQATEERRRINVRSYLQETLLALHPRLKRSPHSLSIACPGDLEVETHPGAVSQIITNLVMNSLMHGFGEQEQGKMEILVSGQPEGVTFIYRDNGRGIPPEHQARLFREIFTTRRGQGGSGLGLQIVYNLVTRLLHGKIEFSSALGKGVEFIFSIPRELPPSKQPE